MSKLKPYYDILKDYSINDFLIVQKVVFNGNSCSINIQSHLFLITRLAYNHQFTKEKGGLSLSNK